MTHKLFNMKIKTRKIITVLGATLLLAANANAQNPGACGTNSTTTGGGGNNYKTYPSTCGDVNNFIPTQTTDTLTFRINYHFFRHSDGSASDMSNVTAQDCKNNVWALNHRSQTIATPDLPTSPPATDVLPDDRIRFVFNNIYFHNDDYGINSPAYYDPYFYNTYAPNPKSTIDVFFLDNMQGGATANAIMPGTINYMFMASDWANTANWPWGPGLMYHEIGHAVGNLTHTNYGPQFPDYTLEQSDAAHWGWVDCTLGSISNNVMGYNKCQEYLSPDQIGNYFLTAAYQSTGVEGTMCSTPYTTLCNWNSIKTVSVTTTQTWTTAKAIGGDLVVKAGNQLTIKCLVSLPPGGRVIVEPTAKLVLDGGTLTTNCLYMWNGVQVWGNSTASQAINVTTHMPTYQGMLSIINGGTIQNAEYGVSLISSDTSGNVDYSKTGGIVQATGASFINNNKDVDFWPYSAANSASYFNNCTFQLGTRSWAGWADARVSLWGIKTVSFSNNTFLNTSSYVGNGITSIDASYSLFNTGTMHNTFSGFAYAINAQNTITSNYIYASNVVVSNCTTGGIYLSNSNYSSITGCSFNINNNNTTSTNYGVYLDHCTGYAFNNNSFTGSTTGIGQNEGAYINASGTAANSSYNNTFNNLTLGHWAGEQNQGSSGASGLVISCNDFTNCTYDIGIQSLTSNSQAGIAKVQGSSSSPSTYARNTYNNSTCSNQNKIYISSAQSYGLSHASFTGNLYEPLPQPGCSNSSIVSVTQGSGTYNKSTYCPANPCGSGCRLADVHQSIKNQHFQLANMPTGNDLEVNAKQAAQDNLSYTQNQYGLVINEKIRGFLNDTTITNPYDSIINLLKTTDHSPATYKVLTALYMQKGDFTNANVYADSVNNAGSSYIDFVKYHKALILLKQNPNYYSTINSNAALKSQMLGYANNYYSEVNAGARAFLTQAYGMKFKETILLPTQSISGARDASTGENTIINLDENVVIYPNPAKDILNIDYSLESNDKATITIIDLNGKVITNILLTQGVNNHSADISMLNNGVYFVTLQKNGVVQSTKKLVIVK